VVICLERGANAYGPADATATHCLLISKIQIVFTSLVSAQPGSPTQRAIKRVCVCCYHNKVAFSALTLLVGFTFLIPAHLGSPGKGPLNGCV